MKTVRETIASNHPHMSDSLVDMMARDVRICLGHCCIVLRQQKTTKQIAALIEGWIEDGRQAEIELDKYNATMYGNHVPVNAPKKRKRGA